MSYLALSFLGGFQALIADKPITAFESNKVRGLLAYLAVEATGVAHSRSLLAELLWSGYGEENARVSLRQTLHHLRKSLGDDHQQQAPSKHEEPEYLLVTRQTIQLNPDADTWVDVTQFSELLAQCHQHAHPHLPTCQTCLPRLRQAEALYRGNFLAGFAVDDSSEFEEWRRYKQEELHIQALDLLATLADAAEANGDYAAASHYARRQIELEPWRDTAHRRLIQLLARSGDRRAAIAQYHAYQQIVKQELGAEPEPETVALYEQIRQANPAESEQQRARSVPIAHNALPTLSSRFVGRHEALAAIQSLFPHTRLVTLTGPSGSGKTRLAIAAAAALTSDFADGVCMVELAPVTNPAWLPQAVAQALYQAASPNPDGQNGVANYLRAKRLLLVLDNCEHLLEAVAQWSRRWLNACPHLCILATSHGPLQIEGEHIWPVPALSYPPATGGLVTDRLMAFEAVQLFVARAQEAKVGFALSETNGSAIAQICQQLEGSPLALELAAARVKVLTPAEIAERFKQRIDATIATNPGAASRHQTLRAALNWSFDLLNPAEQALLRGLAVFSGSFDLMAVEAVVNLPDVLEVLSHLIDKSLVTAEIRGDQTRYRLLAVIREYALDKLAESGEAQELRQRHLDYFLQLVERALRDPHVDDDALWLRPEADNFGSALDWALATDNLTSAVCMSGALIWYWWMRGYLSSLRDPLQQALNYLERSSYAIPEATLPPNVPSFSGSPLGPLWVPISSDSAPGAHLARHPGSRNPSNSMAENEGKSLPAGRAVLPFAAGCILAMWGEPARAQLALTQALALADEEHDLPTAGLALRRLVSLAIQQKAYEAANDFVARALAVWQALGGTWHIAWLYAHQGDIAYQRGDHRQAWLAYEASTKLPVNPSTRAYPFRRMAYLALAHGDAAQALTLCRTSLELNLASGDRAGIAACLVGVACMNLTRAQTLPEAERVLVMRRAAQLLGAVDSLLKTVGGRLLPADEIVYQQTAARLREQLHELAPEAYPAAHAEGELMVVEQAIAFALQEDGVAMLEKPRQHDKVASATATIPLAAPSPLYDWDKMPTVHQFHGRGSELATLAGWVRQDRCRLVIVLGIGGVGKSALVAQMVRAVAGQFAGVIWSSLLNAPPLREIVRHWLRVLTQPSGVTPPEGEEEQLRLLLQWLRHQRYLLVLDNAESILCSTPEQKTGAAQMAGALRPGYEGYAQLLQSLSQDNHESCLLITSRELPQVLSNYSSHTPNVQMLLLAGLDVQAGQALLQAQGLASDDPTALALVQHYSGNPLALQIVANTIADLYDGDIGAFTAEGAPVFDDIRTMLDQQVARLSSLESELLFWLAIEREVVTPATLHNNLVDKGTQRTFLEALRSLQRRSLLEMVNDGFTLQNVIIEYLTDRLVDGVYTELVDEKAIESPSLLATQLLLNRHALLKAGATESVLQSQVRLILRPIAERWLAKVGKTRLVQQARQWLDWLRHAESPHQGYAAGNLLNLLLHLSVDVAGFDFSGLAVWQAYLRGAYLPWLDLTTADLTGTVFTHRFGDIQALLFSSDGDLVVAGIRDGVLRLWRAATGELRQECDLEGIRTIGGGWSQDGRIAAVADVDSVVYLFDVAAGRRLATLTGASGAIWQIRFSVDGRQVACGDTSGQVIVWATSGQRLHTLHGHDDAITGLDYAMGGARPELLASGGVDGIVCVWNAVSGELLHRLEGHRGEVATLGFAQNDTILATASHDSSIRLWDVESGRTLHTLRRHRQLIRHIAVTPMGNLLATTSADTLIYLWDIQSGEVRHVLGDRAVVLNRLCFSPDGQTLATFDVNGNLCLWDVQSGQRVNAFPVYRNPIRSADVSPDRRRVVAGGGDGSLYLWDIGEPAPDNGCGTPTNAGRDQFAGALWARLPGHRHSITAVAFSPDGETLASGDTGQTILLHNLRTQSQKALHGHRSDVSTLSFNADGRLLASGSGDGTVIVWATSGQKLHTLRGHTNAVLCCSFSPDGAQLASGGIDFTVCLWDAERGELRHTLHGHTNAVQSVAFSPDGQRLISSGFDQYIRLWDPHTGQLLATWPTPNTVFLSLAVHPAGELLAAGAQDQLIYLLALPSGQVLGVLTGHSHVVDSVKFSRDGRLLLSSSRDETVKLWQVDAVSGCGVCCQTLTPPGPYAGMKIAEVRGISEAQKAALKELGAVEA